MFFISKNATWISRYRIAGKLTNKIGGGLKLRQGHEAYPPTNV